MRRGEVSNKASKVDGIHTKSYCVYCVFLSVRIPKGIHSFTSGDEIMTDSAVAVKKLPEFGEFFGATTYKCKE